MYAHRQQIMAFNPGELHEAIPDFLRTYARFHRQSLLQLVSGAPSTPSSPPVKFLIFTCLPGRCGGFGDRFKGIASALYLALVTRRVLLIQHPQFPLTDSLLPHGIDWDTPALCLPTHGQTNTTMNTTHPGADPSQPAFDPSQHAVIHALEPPPRYYVDGVYWFLGGVFDGERLVRECLASPARYIYLLLNSAAWNAILEAPAAAAAMAKQQVHGPRLAWAWHFLFRQSDELTRQIAAMRAELGIPGDGTPWVAVHLRVGQATGEFVDQRRTSLFCDIDHAARAFATCAARIAQLVTGRQPGTGTALGPAVANGGALEAATSGSKSEMDASSWQARPDPRASGSSSYARLVVDTSGPGLVSPSAGIGEADEPGDWERVAGVGNKGGVSQGSQGGVGRALDPRRITIFIASDNRNATAILRAALVAGGHDDAAITYTGLKTVHSDMPEGSSPSSHNPYDTRRIDPEDVVASMLAEPVTVAVRDAMVRTMAEFVLLSQATCVVAEGISGFSGMGILLSRDLATGARCYSTWVDFPGGRECGDEREQALMTFRELGPGRHLPMGHPESLRAPFRLDSIFPDGKPTRRVFCSSVVVFGASLCPQRLSVDAVFHMRLSGEGVRLITTALWHGYVLQPALARALGLRESCQVDVLFGRKDRRNVLTDELSPHELDVTITTYMTHPMHQAAVAAHMRAAPGIRNTLVSFMAPKIPNTVTIMFDPFVNVTLGGTAPAAPEALAPSRIKGL
eukprot:jgi/Mesvir1/24352/Mv11028-RA.1